MARIHSLVVESLMDDEENQVRGYVHINDESGMTMGHLSSWSLTDIRNMLRCIQNSTPMRHKETHFINIPNSVTKIIEFAISLLNDKFKARIAVSVANYVKYVGKCARPCLSFSDDAFCSCRFTKTWTSCEKRSIRRYCRRNTAGICRSRKWSVRHFFPCFTSDGLLLGRKVPRIRFEGRDTRENERDFQFSSIRFKRKICVTRLSNLFKLQKSFRIQIHFVPRRLVWITGFVVIHNSYRTS